MGTITIKEAKKKSLEKWNNILQGAKEYAKSDETDEDDSHLENLFNESCAFCEWQRHHKSLCPLAGKMCYNSMYCQQKKYISEWYGDTHWHKMNLVLNKFPIDIKKFIRMTRKMIKAIEEIK